MQGEMIYQSSCPPTIWYFLPENPVNCLFMTLKVVPLEARKRLVGDTVLSGTVKSFYMRGRGGGGGGGRGGPFAGKVKIRRVFRGDSSLEVSG